MPRSKTARSLLSLALIALTGAAAGCTKFLAERMVAPPNRLSLERGAPAAPPAANAAAVELRIPVGPPEAALAVWVRQPPAAPRGTIFLLHGLLNDHEQLEPAARALTAAGYRTVLVDLRGHGRSTGRFITYGVRDAHDLVQLADTLQAKGLCGPRFGAYGVSYGAASALLWAARDPRLQAVVAVAPFASLRQEAPYFGAHIMPLPGLLMSQADYAAIVDPMGALAHFNPDEAAPLAVISHTAARVRLFHGDADFIIPAEASRQLAAAAPDRTSLTIVPGQGHLGLCFDPFGKLRQPTREWFDQWLDEK